MAPTLKAKPVLVFEVGIRPQLQKHVQGPQVELEGGLVSFRPVVNPGIPNQKLGARGRVSMVVIC